MTMETGTKLGFIALVESEMVSILTDARWMLLLILLCVIADFRFGWGESHKRYNEAKKIGNDVLMDKYKWHTSRAWRRTMNKLMDYVVWVTMGMIMGMVALKPFGLEYTYGGLAATLIIVLMCELPSAFGHFFYLHGVQVEKKTISGFIKALVVAFAKRKDEDVGEALEDAFEKTEHERVPENGKSGTHH